MWLRDVAQEARLGAKSKTRSSVGSKGRRDGMRVNEIGSEDIGKKVPSQKKAKKFSK